MKRFIDPKLIDTYVRIAYGPYITQGEACSESLYLKIASMVSEVQNKQLVLDIGCGVGRTTRDISYQCDFVIGMDFSPEMVRKAKEIVTSKNKVIPFKIMDNASIRKYEINSFGLNQKIDFVIGDALWIPFNDETFECIVAVNLFDRVPHPIRAISEIKRVLKFKGTFITTDPYDWNEDFTPQRDAQGRKLWLEKNDILSVLQNLKYTIIDSFDEIVYIEKYHRRKYHVFINHTIKAEK